MPTSINSSGITFPNGTTQTTAASGTVSSVATGNGLQGGTITTSGTLSVACPTQNTVGSYALGWTYRNDGGSATVTFGSNYAAGSGYNQLRAGAVAADSASVYLSGDAVLLSGTWKWMSGTRTYASGGQTGEIVGLVCRVS